MFFSWIFDIQVYFPFFKPVRWSEEVILLLLGHLRMVYFLWMFGKNEGLAIMLRGFFHKKQKQIIIIILELFCGRDSLKPVLLYWGRRPRFLSSQIGHGPPHYLAVSPSALLYHFLSIPSHSHPRLSEIDTILLEILFSLCSVAHIAFVATFQ